MYSEFDPARGSDIWLLDGSIPRPFLQTPFSEGNAQISPDGRRLAYQSNETGRFEIYIQSFPEADRKWQLSTDGGIEPMWSPTGRELFYRNTNKLMAVAVGSMPDPVASKPVPLFAGPYENAFNISPDGQRFLMMRTTGQESAPMQISFVLNWFEELRQRAPRR